MLPVLCEDPQIIGALGAALFAQDRDSAGARGMKVHYGYSDGTGDYFITIDTGRCDGCKECVPACPAAVLEMAEDDSGKLKARVKEEVSCAMSGILFL